MASAPPNVHGQIAELVCRGYRGRLDLPENSFMRRQTLTRVLIGALALSGGAAIPALASAGEHPGGNGHGHGHGNTVTTATTATTPTTPKRDHGLCNAAAHGKKRGWRHFANGAPPAFADLIQTGEALEATTTTGTETSTTGTTTTDTTTTDTTTTDTTTTTDLTPTDATMTGTTITDTTTTETATATAETDEGTTADARADIAAACASLGFTTKSHGHKGHSH